MPTNVGFSQDKYYAELDTDRAKGCIRDVEHAYSKDGGLAVLYGNLAEDGCIVKTAGVDESHLALRGPGARLRLAGGRLQRHPRRPHQARRRRRHPLRRPEGRAGHAGDAVPDLYLKSKNLGKVCALITDGRFSGGTSGLCIGHISPEAAEGGAIALVEEGDRIGIDIPARSISLLVDDPAWRSAGGHAQPRGRGVEAGEAKPRGVDGPAGLRLADHQRRARRGARRPGLEPFPFRWNRNGALNS